MFTEDQMEDLLHINSDLCVMQHQLDQLKEKLRVMEERLDRIEETQAEFDLLISGGWEQ